MRIISYGVNFIMQFYIVMIGLEQEPNNGKTVESEQKINNFGSATLEKKLFSNAFNALDRCHSK